VRLVGVFFAFFHTPFFAQLYAFLDTLGASKPDFFGQKIVIPYPAKN
jgi:hypothetical protein